MQGSYDTSLVVFSILIAALTSYVALEFAGRLFARPDQRGRWLAAGAIAMGSGIWAMHFVGMAAFSLPVPIRYDLGITTLSWLAAIAVSALALAIVSRGTLTVPKVALGALAMGAGICVMHYSGMGAMRMSPGIGYDPLWFSISVLIAVGASAAALVIVSALRVVRSWRDVGLRAAAAVVMGFAVAGMHYSGMAAARFDPSAMCSATNLLDAGLMATPTVLASLLGLGFALFFTISDARAVLQARRAERIEAERLATLAFIDRETGLINRARFSQVVVQAMRRSPRLALVSLRVADTGTAVARAAMPRLVAAISADIGPGQALGRTSPDQLMLLLPDAGGDGVIRDLLPRLRRRLAPLAAQGLAVGLGVSAFPEDGDNVQALMLRAGSRATGEDELDAAAARPPGPLGEVRPYRSSPAPAWRGSAA